VGLTLAGAALVLMAAACAPEGDPGNGNTPTTTAPPTSVAPTTSTTSTTSQSVSSADVTIEIGTADQPGEFRATLRCETDESGSGYLADSAPAACEYLRTSSAARLLLAEGPDPDRACTEIYGGGEVARITGTLTGIPVDVTIDRANGCGIADWDLLQPILVAPYDLARLNATSHCSGATAAIGNDDNQGELPPLVADLRTTLLSGAALCDLDGLAAWALADGTNVSFGGSDNPAALWRDLESEGATPMSDLITILQLAPGVTDDGQGTFFYVWPAVAAMDDWSDATEGQRSELAQLFGVDALADWDLFGGYIGYRVGITDSGRWAFFVQGD
jgi:hypothetical protein